MCQAGAKVSTKGLSSLRRQFSSTCECLSCLRSTSSGGVGDDDVATGGISLPELSFRVKFVTVSQPVLFSAAYLSAYVRSDVQPGYVALFQH